VTRYGSVSGAPSGSASDSAVTGVAVSCVCAGSDLNTVRLCATGVAVRDRRLDRGMLVFRGAVERSGSSDERVVGKGPPGGESTPCPVLWSKRSALASCRASSCRRPPVAASSSFKSSVRPDSCYCLGTSRQGRPSVGTASKAYRGFSEAVAGSASGPTATFTTTRQLLTDTSSNASSARRPTTWLSSWNGPKWWSLIGRPRPEFDCGGRSRLPAVVP